MILFLFSFVTNNIIKAYVHLWDLYVLAGVQNLSLASFGKLFSRFQKIQVLSVVILQIMYFISSPFNIPKFV